MRSRQPEAVKNNVNMLNVPVSSKRSNVAVDFLKIHVLVVVTLILKIAQVHPLRMIVTIIEVLQIQRT